MLDFESDLILALVGSGLELAINSLNIITQSASNQPFLLKGLTVAVALEIGRVGCFLTETKLRISVGVRDVLVAIFLLRPDSFLALWIDWISMLRHL